MIFMQEIYHTVYLKKDSLTGENITYYVGGTSNMLGYLNKYRDKKSLVLNGGDDFQGNSDIIDHKRKFPD
jgi:hypothetical protein